MHFEGETKFLLKDVEGKSISKTTQVFSIEIHLVKRDRLHLLSSDMTMNRINSSTRGRNSS